MAASRPSQILMAGVWHENPIFRQVLGICSALAVTNLVYNTLLMCFGLVFSAVLTNFTVSLLRNHIPKRIRMMVQVFIIASWVMIVDIIIKAISPDVHSVIGPYVGLIITNCIIMGRAEAFASSNKPVASIVDGFGSGIGYSLILIIIACVREPLGFGTLLGYSLPARDLWWHQWTIMLMPPGAFFMLAAVTWLARGYFSKPAQISANRAPVK